MIMPITPSMQRGWAASCRSGWTCSKEHRAGRIREPEHALRTPKRWRLSMDAAALRAMQAPIKERYKSTPEAAIVTLKAKGTLDAANIVCKVETGRALAVAGLHPATGGSGLELCSGDMLLEALVACAGVTLKAVA